MKNILFILSLVFIFGNVFAEQRIPETVIKIGLLDKVQSFNISCEGEYYIFEMKTGLKENIKPMDDYFVTVRGDVLTVGMMKYSAPIRIMPKTPGEKIRINGKRYRDSIYVSAASGEISVVNELGIEDYLYGVLPKEVDPGWGKEALKAQAVVSRTFLLKNLKRHVQNGFDLCDTVHCQVYGGVETEQEMTSAAVEQTRGMVIVYNDKLASGLFHACCAGRTENPGSVWTWDANTPEYLKGVKCKFCKKSPHYSWVKEVPNELLTKRLIKAGFNVGQIKKIERLSKTGSGRVKAFKVKSSKGVVSISGNKFRLAVGPEVVRSTYVDSISCKNKFTVFKGRGWGHGVGMCQWGAKVMSDKKYSFKDILKYYFPGTKVERWEE